MERATRSAVRCRVPVSEVGMVALGMRWTLARAIREASGGQDDGPVHLGQLGQPLGAELGVEQEAARADGEHARAVAHHHQGAALGPQDPVESVTERPAGSRHGQGVTERRALTGGHRRMVAVPDQRRSPGDPAVPGAMRAARLNDATPARGQGRTARCAPPGPPCPPGPAPRPGGPSGDEAGTTTRSNPSRAALLEPAGQVGDLAHLAGQPDLAHRGQGGRRGPPRWPPRPRPGPRPGRRPARSPGCPPATEANTSTD